MRYVSWLSLVCAVAALVVAVTREPARPETSTAAVDVLERKVQDLAATLTREQRRITTLENELADARDRLDELRAHVRTSSPTAPKAPAPTSPAAPDVTHAAVPVTVADDEGNVNPEIAGAVREVLAQQRRAEREEWERRHSQMQEGWAGEMTQKLSLDGPQVQRFTEIVAWHAKARGEVFADMQAGKLSDRSPRAAMRALDDEYHQKIKELLTADQLARYEAMDSWERRPPRTFGPPR